MHICNHFIRGVHYCKNQMPRYYGEQEVFSMCGCLEYQSGSTFFINELEKNTILYLSQNQNEVFVRFKHMDHVQGCGRSTDWENVRKHIYYKQHSLMLQQHKCENSTWCKKIQKHLEIQSCKYICKVIFFSYDYFFYKLRALALYEYRLI